MFLYYTLGIVSSFTQELLGEIHNMHRIWLKQYQKYRVVCINAWMYGRYLRLSPEFGCTTTLRMNRWVSHLFRSTSAAVSWTKTKTFFYSPTRFLVKIDRDRRIYYQKWISLSTFSCSWYKTRRRKVFSCFIFLQLY